jgi:hypothetical protein
VNSISVVIAVYKPGIHLERLKKNLNEQRFSTKDSKVEIVLVDGECSRNTKEFCRTNSFRYIENPSVDPVSAKELGLVNSEFELVCFIDQDEEFSNNFALDNRIKEFNATHELVLLFPTGYTINKEMGSANIYTTLFGDPLNRFVHAFPNNEIRDSVIRKRCDVIETISCNYFLEKRISPRPILMEFGCMGSTVHKSRLISSLNRDVGKAELPHLYYLVSKNLAMKSVGILRNDGILHHSSENWRVVREKISWRVKNNLSKSSPISRSGITGRLPLAATSNAARPSKFFHDLNVAKVLFALYTLSIVLPLMSAILLAFRYRKLGLIYSSHLDFYLLLKYLAIKTQRIFGKHRS